MRPFYLSILLYFLFGFQLNIQAQTQVEEFVYFETDQVEIEENFRTVLNDFIEKLENFEIHSIEIEGHTDQDGTEIYNQTLSNLRAKQIAHYLINHGLTKEYLDYQGKGETNLLTTETNPEAKAINRRVKIKASVSPLPPIVVEPKVFTEPEKKIEDLLVLKKDFQNFEINATEGGTIYAEEGTIVRISENSFETLSGKDVKDEIMVSIKEYYRTSDMLLAKLSTMSNGRMLETGGMVYIEARYKNQELKLKRGKDIEILLATRGKAGDMLPFMGAFAENGEMNWARSANTSLLNKVMFEDSNDYRNGKNCGGVVDDSNCSIDPKLLPFWKKVGEYFIPGKHTFCRNRKPYYKNDELWETGMTKQELAAKQAAFKNNFAELIENAPDAQTVNGMANYYIMNNYNLGWINCDRFYYLKEQDKTNLIINEKPDSKTNYKVVFKNINSIMAPTYSGNRFGVFNVPKNQNVIIVAIRYNNNTHQIELKLEETNTSRWDENLQLDFEVVSADELKRALNKLN